MYLKYDWPLTFNEEQFVAFHGEPFIRLLKKQQRLAHFREAVAEMRQAMEPAACWDIFSIEKILHDKLVLANGETIGGGPVVTVVGGAEALIVAVCTIGPHADRLIKTAQKSQDLFKIMILHDLATWGVEMVRQQLCRQFEEEAQQKELRVSAPLSPGESDWPVKDQAIIFKLIDAAQIGLSLSPSMIMIPLKSVSWIMGTGRNPMGVEGASNCDFCAIRERCPYRRWRPIAQPAF